ncbi:MAG TPA: hypothetical protein VIG61_08005 [Fusobacterium sp.]|uniref:hypothetical protein n=1 Tax=Fusobacterium sp. TaxID=68766 RepID=UPI002F412C0D
MTSPKERVRANVYKELLKQEKRRNQKLSIVSVSVFLLGIFASSGYNALYRTSIGEESPSYVIGSERKVKEFEKDSFILDSIYNTGILHEKTVSLNPDELFGLDTQI